MHLVGSVNLPDAESVFRAVGSEFGDRLKRTPDGEVGRPFGQWLMPAILRSGEIYPTEGGAMPGLVPVLCIRDDVTAPIDLGELGIANAALESLELLRRLKREGAVDEAVRLQVGMPTPLTLAGLAEPAAQERVHEALMRSLKAEIAKLVTSVPHDELALQFELPGEVGILEGVFPCWFGPKVDTMAAFVNDLTSEVPTDVEVGIHLCYGSPPSGPEGRGQHWAEPADAGLMVSLANALVDHVQHPLAFIHMPVPISRDDEGFFKPLTELRASSDTELFLGLVHDQDGLEGSKRRLAAAAAAGRPFGVSTECGIGRVPDGVAMGLLRLQRETADLTSPASVD